MKIVHALFFSALAAIVFFSCNKEEPAAPKPVVPSPYFVRMTDAPGPYTAVNVDIQGVEVTTSGSTTMLNVNPGVYNLIDFSNGVDTLIATGNLVAERVQQIRLILGPNNSVEIGGITYPLSTPSAQQSGLKLQVHQTLQAGVAYYVLLDFDANQSIVYQGNGTYSLKPVIRTIDTAISGAIKGSVTPAGVNTMITATTGTFAYSSPVDINGEFIIKGIPAGTYSLNINPASPYTATSVSGVVVVTGITTTVSLVSI